MTSPIAAAAAAARAASQSVRGESVTFSRGAYSLTLTAVRGSTGWDRSAPYGGIRIGDRSTDWILEAADLVDSNGDQIKPARQDEITVDGVTFRVMPYGPDNQLWMYHDRERTYIRIHTKERV